MPDRIRVRRALCSSLALLLISGCATRGPKPEPATPVAAPTVEVPAIAEAADSAPAAAASSATTPEPVLHGWARIRQGYGFVDCSQLNATARHWQGIYTQSPKRFDAEMAQLAPFFHYLAEALMARGMPTELLWLPYIESRYQPFRSSGNRPGGYWQFMPGTARAYGLPIHGHYDGRRDFHASTRAALDLMQALAKRFDGNWRFAIMAFNAGENRIARALREASAGTSHEQLKVSRITHEHLAKIEGMACVAREPESFGVTMAELPEPDRLLGLMPGKAVDLRALAQHLGVPTRDLMRFNAAWSSGVSGKDATLLLPGSTHAAALSYFATRAGASEPVERPASDATHVVAAGESLWLIARKHRVRLADLMAENGLTRHSVLRIGQVLVLPAP